MESKIFEMKILLDERKLELAEKEKVSDFEDKSVGFIQSKGQRWRKGKWKRLSYLWAISSINAIWISSGEEKASNEWKNLFEVIMAQNAPNELKTATYICKKLMFCSWINFGPLPISSPRFNQFYSKLPFIILIPNTVFFKTMDSYNRITFRIFRNFPLIPFFSSLRSRRKAPLYKT